MNTSNTEEVFANHPARTQLIEVTAQARNLLERHGQSFDELSRKRLMRVVRVLEFAAHIIKRADPELSNLLGTLDAFKAQLDTAASSLASMGPGNPGMIKQAVGATDQILALMDRFPPRVVVDSAAELTKLISGLRSQQDEILAEATQKASTAIQLVTSDHAKAEKEINQKIASAAELGATVERLQKQIGQQSGRLDSALTSFTTQTATLDQQRESRFQEWLGKQTEGIATKSGEEIAKVTKLLKNTEVATDAAISRLEESKREAARILNVIGNIAATGNYKLVADENEKTANALRNGAVGLFLLMVVVVVTLAYNVILDGFRWDVAAFRLVSVLILSLPAAYLARESARHREVAGQARRMELELASLDAFNALLPDTERNSIKAEMARRYFGNGGSLVPDAKADAEQALTIKSLLQEATSLVKAIRG